MKTVYKAKTGIDKLDKIISGGIPEKHSVLLMGPPKSGKTLLSSQFLFEGLKNNEYGVYIITNDFPEKIVKTLENFGKVEKILEKGLLKFVDCYSINVGVEKGDTVFVVRVNGPTSLSEIGIALSEILKKIPQGSRIRVVLDSISTLLLYNSPGIILSFIQVINGKIKSSGASSMYILEEGAHDERSITSINSFLDALIYLNKNKIEISGFGVSKKSLNYTIKKGKINI